MNLSDIYKQLDVTFQNWYNFFKEDINNGILEETTDLIDKLQFGFAALIKAQNQLDQKLDVTLSRMDSLDYKMNNRIVADDRLTKMETKVNAMAKRNIRIIKELNLKID